MAYSTVKEWLTAICDAIRSKSGTVDKITHEDIPDKIAEIGSDADVTIEEVVDGKIFYNSEGRQIGGLPTFESGESVIYQDDEINVSIPTNKTDYLRFAKKFTEFNRAFLVGSGIYMDYPLSSLGDAKTAEVVKGKTFTSASGLLKTGTLDLGTRIDTSDATATASDMVEGTTAYVDGELITGTLPYENVTYNVTPTEYLGNLVFKYGENSPKRVISGDINFKLETSLGNLGNAVASDVISGKTFTSAAGLLVTGTGSASGGLTMKTGTTTSQTFDTGLSSVSCFALCVYGITGVGLMSAMYGHDGVNTRTVNCYSYTSASAAGINIGSVSGAVTIDGGTITWNPTVARNGAFQEGQTYYWMAFGT